MLSNDLINKPFHILLKRLLEEQDRSISWLAKRIGKSDVHVGNLIREPERYKPTKEIIISISKELHVKPEIFREYRVFTAKEKIDEKPGLADALADNMVADLTVRFADATPEEKEQIDKMIEDYWQKRHGKKD